MNKFEELANLIFPDITQTLEDLEKRFPKRDLPIGAMVTRFAPSPTGFLHTGSLYAAMISEKFARQTGGVFILRLEDTDTKREIAGSGEMMVNQLANFGVKVMEGYFGENKEVGSYGPYKQSARAEIYKTVIKYMITKNMVYPCFCTQEELAEMRAVQEAKKDNTGYYGEYAKCSKLTPDEAIELIKAGKPYVLRFRSLGDHNNKIKVYDEIHGDIELAENDQHIVVLKSDGLPTYHFAHLCDDHFMRTTHITRGEEWLPSLPIHIQLFESIGWVHPHYAHLSNIMKLDNGVRRKLSKRKDAEAAVEFFLTQGYPIEGFMKFLFTLANSNFEEWAINNPEVDFHQFEFSFNKMNIDGALFDLEKAKFYCKEYLGNLTTKEFVEGSLGYAKLYDENLLKLIECNKDFYSNIISIEREQEKPRKDYEKYSDVCPLIKFFYNEEYNKMLEESGYALPENISKENVLLLLNTYLKHIDLDKNEEEWFSDLKVTAVECGFAETPKIWKQNKESYPGHVGDLAAVLRGVLALRLQTPNLYYIMKVLGKDEVIKRIENAINSIK